MLIRLFKYWYWLIWNVSRKSNKIKFNGNDISMIYTKSSSVWTNIEEFSALTGFKLSGIFFIQWKCIQHIFNTNNCFIKHKGLKPSYLSDGFIFQFLYFLYLLLQEGDFGHELHFVLLQSIQLLKGLGILQDRKNAKLK